MDEFKLQKIREFLNNKPMADAVYEILFTSFINQPSKDIYILGASRLSVDFLKQGWDRLKSYSAVKEPEKPEGNIGL